MGIDYKNPEGYPDPTAYEAMKPKYMPLVYVCSPFSGDTETNVANARRYCRYAVDHDAIPLAPHLLFPQFMDEATEREKAMFMNKVLLGRCEELWVFGEERSAGMIKEIEWARRKRMVIRYFGEV